MGSYSPGIYLSVFCLAAVIWLARFFFTRTGTSRCHRHQEITGRTLQGCKDLINDEFHGQTSRASANVGLARAFNIDNVFTTTDIGYAAAFKNKAKGLINLSEQQWEGMAERVQVLARSCVAIQLADSKVVNVARLAQTTALRALLPVIFPDSPGPTSRERDLQEAAVVVADKISALWKSSKQSPAPPDEAADLRALESAIRVLLPGSAVSPARANPLNLIIPAWETTWRLVFQCFLEVVFRNVEHSKEYRGLLSAYLRNPTTGVFKRREAGGVSLYDIVLETLRLYPPTKNIYRSDGKAEIGFIQRSAEFWGADAGLFRPERWVSTCVRDAAFLPFGSKPFLCPAKEPFAPRATGLLVAGTLEVLLERGEWEATSDCGVGVPGALWNKRGVYEDFCIKLVDPGQK